MVGTIGGAVQRERRLEAQSREDRGASRAGTVAEADIIKDDPLRSLPDDGPGLRAVQKLAETTRDADQQDRSVRGFNLLGRQDHELFCSIARGEFAISGMTNRRLRQVLQDRTAAQLSRLLRALRLHGLIKKVGRTYKYYLTELGRRTTAAALKLRDLLIVPALARSSC